MTWLFSSSGGSTTNVANEAADEDDLEAVKAKHEKVKTQKTELEVARMRGQLIDVADVKRLWGDIANTLSKNLLHIGSIQPPSACWKQTG